MIKAIIFDYDGVIRHVNIEQARIASKKVGFEFEELMKLIWGNEASRELIRGLIDADTWWKRVVSLNDALKNVPQNFIWEVLFKDPIIDYDVLSYIDNLYEHYIVAILSNANEKSKVFIKNEIESTRFHHIMTSSDFGYIKPEEEVFTAALEKLCVNADECIFFDDKENNAAGAKKVGIHGFVFDNLNQMINTIEDVSRQALFK